MANVGSAEPLTQDQMIQNLLASQQDQSGVPGGHLTLDQILARGQGGGTDQLAALKTLLGGVGGQQQGGGGYTAPTSSSIMTNPLYDLTRIGAAVTGQPMVINPTPQAASGKGGVYSGAQTPIVSTRVPTAGAGPQTQVPGLVGGSAQNFTQFAAPAPTVAWNPSTYGNQPITPVTAAPTQQAQPFATAQGNPPQMWPPPPAIQAPTAPSMPTITGGAPQPWGIPGGQPIGIPPAAPGMMRPPAPYSGTVYDDPSLSRAVSSMLGFHTNPWHDESGTPRGASVALSTSATPAPRKMESGGTVPGKGDKDTVPALLTPGEYVIPKWQVDQIRRGQSVKLSPKKFNSGGYVDDDQRKLPPEVRRPSLSTSEGTASTGATTTGSAQHDDSTAAAAIKANLASSLSGGGPNFLMLQAMARQHLQNQQAIAQAGGSAPGLGQAAQATWATGANPNAGLPVGVSGYVNAVGQQIAPTPGTTGYPGMSPTAVGAMGVGAIGSAISDAANKYAQSVGSWKWQPSAIPGPEEFRRQRQINLQQENVT